MPEYASLKNQVLEHVAAYVNTLPEGATSLSISGSIGISYSKPEG